MNNSRDVMRRLRSLAFVGMVGVSAATWGCNSEPTTPDVGPVGAPVEPAETVEDPLAIMPEDISLWETFDPNRILKQPGTNTLVVEGVIAGDAATLAGELETATLASGWSTETMTTHGGLTTLIMSKEVRRLKVNLTQDGETVHVYLTTRLPE